MLPLAKDLTKSRPHTSHWRWKKGRRRSLFVA